MTVSPKLPAPAGPVSGALIAQLSGRVQDLTRVRPDGADPMGRDIQLALFVAYELCYRGFRGTDPTWEWDADLVGLRGRLERSFLGHLRRCAGDITGTDVWAEIRRPAGGQSDGPAHFLRTEGTWQQMCEYFVHRSVYHLKEPDLQAWLIPRLAGAAKAAVVAVQYQNYGAGTAAHMRQRIFAELMSAAGLDGGYLAYLDMVPAEALAAVNAVSMFGLNRSLRGAAIGHFAAEMTSAPASQRLVQALHRLRAPAACARFYRDRIEPDAVSGRLVDDIVGGLLADEPELEADVVLGIRARHIVEDRLAARMVKCWADGETSLLRSL